MDQDYKLLLTNVRLNYPKLFRAEKPKTGEGEPKFTAAFSMLKGDKQVAKVNALITQLLKEKNKGKPLPADKLCFRDGDLSDSFEDGTWYISASNRNRPQVIDRSRSPIVEEDDIVYGGCYVNALVRFWFQDNQFGKRVNASLEAVQFYKDGERFGAAPVDVDEVFAVIDDNDPDLV